MTVALGGRDPISLWVGLPLSPIGKKSGHAWRHWHARRHWHALDENEYTRPNIAISETTFLGVLMQRWSSCEGSRSRCGVRWLQGTTWHSPASCPCACSKIKRPNMPGVQASVFYSTTVLSESVCYICSICTYLTTVINTGTPCLHVQILFEPGLDLE